MIFVSSKSLSGWSSDSTVTRASLGCPSGTCATDGQHRRIGGEGDGAGRPRGWARATKTYRNEGSGAEAGSSVKPVVAAEFVHLDTLLVGRLTLVRLMRHRLCHHRRPERPSRDGADGADVLARRRRAGGVVEGGEEKMASFDGRYRRWSARARARWRGLDPSMVPRRWEVLSRSVSRRCEFVEARVLVSAEENIKGMDRAMGEGERARGFQRQELRGRRELRSGGDGRADAAQCPGKVGYGTRHQRADGMSRVLRGR